MDSTTIEQMRHLLMHAEQQLDKLTLQSANVPQPVSFEMRAEYAAYLRELNQSAAAWQAQTQQLIQILSDHPGLIQSVPPVPRRDTAALDRAYARRSLGDTWERQTPMAFMHAGAVHDLARPSFRELYRQVLSDMAVRMRGVLGARCFEYQGERRIAVTRDEGVYNHAVYRTDGYIFNIQLSADGIRRSIASLYDIGGLSMREFAVWVQ